jgi:hypothetical protein
MKTRYIFPALLLVLSGCGPSATSDDAHLSLTLKQRYDNSIKELSSVISHPESTSQFAFIGDKAALDFLNSNSLTALKNTHFVNYLLSDRESKEPRITVFWVGDKLQLSGIKISDSKSARIFNIPLPSYFIDDMKQKEKSYVFYAAIFDVDNNVYQSLKKDDDEGAKLEIEAY